MPHPALVERQLGFFDDPYIRFDDGFYIFDLELSIVIDQHFRRGVERPEVFYNEIVGDRSFDAHTVEFDSFLVAFDDQNRYLQNFSSRGRRDGSRRRPSVVVLA